MSSRLVKGRKGSYFFRSARTKTPVLNLYEKAEDAFRLPVIIIKKLSGVPL